MTPRSGLFRTIASRIAAVSVLLLAVACSPRQGTVEGVASIDDAPAAGAEIQAFVKAGAERSGTPFATGAAREDGFFSLPLPPGSYHLVARRTVRAEGRDRTYKAEYSGNPVRVSGGETVKGISFALVEMSSGGFVPRRGTGVTGAVVIDGKPAKGVYVYAYPDNVGTVRGPSYAAFARAGEDGRFRIVLREGAFRIVAREKGGENETGAMSSSGKTGGDEGIPVRLEPGSTRDLGRIALRSPDEGKRRRRAAGGGQAAPAAEIRGAAVREDGSPAPGVYVMAYADHRMIGRPFAITGRTGTDGAFILKLPKPGKYFLGARGEYGGPVSPGEPVGMFDGSPDHGVLVRDGERLDGIRIRVAEKW